jgi:SAM-dependent methyltransferase
MSADTARAEKIRSAAIDHHDAAVSTFESYYASMEKSRFANAFTYGRQKVNLVLEAELRRVVPGARVLDIGCGTGVYLRRFKELGLVPVGLEPAPGMLETARRTNPGIEIVQGVASTLPFADGTFDFINALEVYRYLHLSETRLSFAECRRVLRPGGIFFATLVNRWALDGFFIFQRVRQLYRRAEFNRRHPHCEFFTPAEARHELSAAGFENVRMLGRLAAPMRLIYKGDARLGAMLARRFESLDDRVHELRWTTPFAGHLIAMGEKSRAVESQ